MQGNLRAASPKQGCGTEAERRGVVRAYLGAMARAVLPPWKFATCPRFTVCTDALFGCWDTKSGVDHGMERLYG